MKGVNINDWQTIQTRNYVKKIKESISSAKATDWAIVIDIFLLLVSFLLDKIYEESEIPKCVWSILLLAGIFSTIIVLGIFQIRKARIERLIKILPSHEEIVASFDEEVCYKLMSAVSFLDNLKALNIEKKDSSDLDRSLAIFYYSEVIYYLNKAISILFSCSKSLTDVLTLISVDTTPQIAVERVENVCELVDAIYAELGNIGKKADCFSEQQNALEKRRREYERFKSDVQHIKEHLTQQKESH